jgi:hypothetical protein
MSDFISERSLAELLERQDTHDAQFHREIARLSRGPRMQHLALHVAKYVGKIAGIGDENEQELVGTLTDCVIICLSACNTLGIPASEIVSLRSALSDPTQELTLDRARSSVEHLALRMAKSAGKLAKACEALDHLEPINYALELRNAVVETFFVVWDFAMRSNMDLRQSISRRWEQIERNRVP